MALILIVDDSPTEVFQMRRMLESHGFETEGAADGAERIGTEAGEAPLMRAGPGFIASLA